MNNNCFGYIRVSTVKQGEGVSLEAQKQAIEAFASQNNLTIIKWFEEKETAAKCGRPIFNQMVAELRAQKAHGLIIHKIDRSARNFTDWAKIGELADQGINIHFATESLDFRSRGGRLTADIQAVIAADYIRNLREETIKGLTGRLKQGLYPFKAPLGYLDNGGGQLKTIDPERGSLVRQMFELYATGQHSLNSLVEEMNNRGLQTKYGRPLHKSNIERILSNPFYMGLIEVRTTRLTYPGAHEPLISATLFNDVQEAKHGKARKKRTKHNYLYRGLFRCEDCAKSMIPERQKGHVYYRCQTKQCPTKTIREHQVQEGLIEQLSHFEIDPKQAQEFTQVLRQRVQGLTKIPTHDVGQALIAQIASQRDKLTDALLNGTITDDVYKRKHKELQIKQAEAIERQQNQSSLAEKAAYIERFLELSKNVADTYLSALPHEKRQIVELAFSNRTVRHKTPYFETADWLLKVRELPTGLYGGLYGAISRSLHDLSEDEFEEQLELAGGNELREFVDLLGQIENRDAQDDLPDLPIVDDSITCG